MIFSCKHFNELSLEELYAAMVLRQMVFSVEQQCSYLDADGKDQASYHLFLKSDSGELLAYSRLIPTGVAYADYASIGRVVSHPAHRKEGLGKMIMERSLQEMQRVFPGEPIKIGAQEYLNNFYESFGFVDIDHRYIEDGIWHIQMTFVPGSK